MPADNRPPGKPVAIQNTFGALVPKFGYMPVTVSLWQMCLDDLNGVSLIILLTMTPFTVILDVLYAPFAGMAWVINRLRKGGV